MKHTADRKILAALSVVLMLTILLTSAAFAADGSSRTIDPDRKGTLVIREITLNSKEPITDLNVLLYKIGDIDTDEIKVVPAGDYKGASLDLEDLETVEKQLAQADKAKAFIDEKGLKEDYSTLTDAAGEAHFADIPVGLYLVAFDSDDSGIPGAFLIQLPSYSDEAGGYEYDITAIPKSPAVEKLTSRTVIKVWKDNDNKEGKRTKSIKVSLICNGKTDKPYDTVELSDANNWSYIWDSLDKSAEWTVVEEDIPAGYVSKTTYNGTEITITNTYNEGKLPQTGQNYTIVLILAAVGVALVVIGTAVYIKSAKKKEQ